MKKITAPRKLSQRVHRDYLISEAEHFREHKKGLPEWIKNSDDSYTRHEEFDNADFSNLPILLNFSKNEILCLDFGGTTGEIMEEHIPFYGSPKASTQGKNLSKKSVSGGHGNGGKYYALAQFEDCKVISYYSKKLSILTINKDGDYMDMKDEPCSAWEAFKLAGLDDLEYFEKEGKELYSQISKGKLNFFCWRGIKPRDKNVLANKMGLGKLTDAISNDLQARPALRSRVVDVLWNGRIFWPSLRPKQVEVDASFGTKEFPLPKKLGDYNFNENGESILRITLSTKVLNGDSSSLNILEIDANGRNIAYYHIPELTLDKGFAKYLVAHIDCPELKKDYKCVSNDRVHLKEKEVSDLFLNWCKERIQEVLDLLRNKEKTDEENKEKENLGAFLNEVLDEFNDLLEEEDILKDVYNKSSDKKTEVFSPTGGPGYGGTGKVKKKGGGRRSGKFEKKEDSSSSKKSKGTIKILVSNYDDDPLNPGKKHNMVEREPILNQRIQDVPHGIWWINSQKKYIRNLKVKDQSSWPFYFVLIKEIVYSHRQRKRFKEGEEYDPDVLEQLNFDLIDEVFNRAVEKFKIDILYDEEASEKIRHAIKNKDKFDVPTMAEELGINPLLIHSFILQNNEYIEKNFNFSTDKLNGRQIKVFTKK